MLTVVADSRALARAAAEHFIEAAAQSIEQRGTCAIALTGGQTAKEFYTQLASDPALPERVAWSRCVFFIGDERHVPPDHPDSNYRMAFDTLLSRLPIQPLQIFRVKTERDAAAAAADYEATLRDYFRLEPGEWPRFDLTLLGLGPDAHTASLFPGSPALEERTRLVVATWVNKLAAYRITLTVPVLNHSARVLFVVGGSEKAEAVKAVLEGAPRPTDVPAQMIRPTSGVLTWLIDEAAAQLLGSTRR